MSEMNDKPSEQWLIANNVKIDGTQKRVPKKGESWYYLAAFIPAVALADYREEDETRWILKPRLTEADIPLCPDVRKKDLPDDVIERAVSALVRYANDDAHACHCGKNTLVKTDIVSCAILLDSTEEGFEFWKLIRDAPYKTQPPQIPQPSTWWMVLNPYSGTAPKTRHETEQSAIDEATRLATKEGKKCHVLKLIGTAYPVEARYERRA